MTVVVEEGKKKGKMVVILGMIWHGVNALVGTEKREKQSMAW